MDSLAFSDLNECTETPDACLNGRCENTDGSYRCICIDGFTLSPDRRVCQGIVLWMFSHKFKNCLKLQYLK